MSYILIKWSGYGNTDLAIASTKKALREYAKNVLHIKVSRTHQMFEDWYDIIKSNIVILDRPSFNSAVIDSLKHPTVSFDDGKPAEQIDWLKLKKKLLKGNKITKLDTNVLILKKLTNPKNPGK